MAGPGFTEADIRALADPTFVTLTHYDRITFELLSFGYLRRDHINPNDVGIIVAKFIDSAHCVIGFNKKTNKYEHSSWAMTLFYPELVYLQLTIAENTKKFVKYKHITIKFEEINCLHKDYCSNGGYYMQCGVVGIPKSSERFGKVDKRVTKEFKSLKYKNCTFYNLCKQNEFFKNCQTYYLHCTSNKIGNTNDENGNRIWCSIGKDNIYNFVTLVDAYDKNKNKANKFGFVKGDTIDIRIQFVEKTKQWVLIFVKNSKHVIGKRWIELENDKYYYYAGLVSIACNCTDCLGFKFTAQIKDHIPTKKSNQNNL